MSILREFFIKIGAKVDKSAMGKAESAMKDVGKSAAYAAAGVGALLATSYLFKNFVDSVTKAGDEVIKMSRNLGLTSDELQKYQYAGGIAGVSAAEMGNSVKFLNKNISEASEGLGTGKRAFDRLGISVKDANGKLKSNTVIFEEIAGKITGLGKEQKTATLMEIFGRSGSRMGNLFLEGSKGVKELFNRFDELNLAISEDNMKAMEEYNDRVFESELATKKLKSVFVSALLPVLTKMAEAWSKKLATAIKWVTENTDKITESFSKFLKVLKYAAIGGLLFSLGQMGIALGSLVTAFSAVGVAGAMAWAKALIGPLLLGGAIAAVSLLIEDLWQTYMNPEAKTFTNWLLDRFENRFPKAFESIKTMINAARLSLAGWGLIISKIFGDAESQRIWGEMIKEYGGKVYESSAKASGLDENATSWQRFRNFPGIKTLIDASPLTAAANALEYNFMTSPPGAMDFAPSFGAGKTFNIQNVTVPAGSGNIDEFIMNVEKAAEEIK
ncbi:MAG TPA: phage tail tape measure protein [bacterium]|nr:phage tail tape measure protein [bacterium]